MKSEKLFRIYEILLNIPITTIVFITNFAQNQTYFLTKANFSMHFLYNILLFIVFLHKETNNIFKSTEEQ